MQVYVWVPDSDAVFGVDVAVLVLTPEVASVPEQVHVVGSPFLRSLGIHDADAVGFVVSMINVRFVFVQSLLLALSLQ